MDINLPKTVFPLERTALSVCLCKMRCLFIISSGVTRINRLLIDFDLLHRKSLIQLCFRRVEINQQRICLRTLFR